MRVTIDGKPGTVAVIDAIVRIVACRAYEGSLAHAQLLMRDEYREPPPVLIVELDPPPTPNLAPPRTPDKDERRDIDV